MPSCVVRVYSTREDAVVLVVSEQRQAYEQLFGRSECRARRAASSMRVAPGRGHEGQPTFRERYRGADGVVVTQEMSGYDPARRIVLVSAWVFLVAF